MHIRKPSAPFGISCHRQAVRKLRAAEAKSRLLLESVSNGIWGLNPEGRVTFVNSAAARLLGYSPEELIGRLMHEMVHHTYPDGSHYPLEACPMHATLADGKQRVCLDEVLWRKDGTSFPVEYSTYPLISDAAQIGAVVVFQDVSERKFSERRAQQDQIRLRSLIDSAMDAIVSMDECQNITLFNRAAEQMFGYQAGDIIGQPLARLLPSHLHGKHRQHVASFGSAGVTMRTMSAPGSLKGERASGEEFDLEASISRANVAGENSYTAILRDVTQRKQTEAQIEKTQRLLEAISQAQSHFIIGSEHRKTFDSVLNILLDYSGSEYGFIGEVFRDEAGNPYLKAYAITNIAWNEETQALYEKYAEQGLEFRNLNTLFGRVMTTGKAVISNDPANDPRAGGLPHGHPAMHAFLGLPLYNGTELIGMLGIANRDGGYDAKFYDELSPLAASCASLIESWREYAKRRQAEEALRLSQERLLQAIRIAGIGLFDHDYLTGVMYWSPEIRAIFGLPLDEPISADTLHEFLHPDDRERVIATVRNAQSPAGEGGFNLSHRIVRRDGEMRWVEVQLKTTFSGEGEARRTARTLGAVRDITRRKQNEESLQLAALVYQSSREGILVTDENNLIIDVNPAFTQLTGYTLDEVRGKNPRMFSSGRHDAGFYRQMWQSIGESGHWQGEIWDKRRDGELHVKWLNISVICQPDGSIFRHVAQFSDITEKKRQDEKIWAQANFDACQSKVEMSPD